MFDPTALRSEDTLFLANLMQAGELPLFLPGAIIQHVIPLSLLECFLKDVRSAYLDRRAAELIASMRVRLRASHRERIDMLSSMWRTSKQRSIGRAAWFVVIARQGLLRFLSIAFGFLRIGPNSDLPAIVA